MQKNKNRPGYKKTKVGWIPEDWQCSVFGDAFHILLGKMLNKKARDGADQAPYLANVNVRWGAFDLSEVRTMGFSDREKEKFALRDGDLLVCEGGETGRCAIWRAEIAPCFYQKALHRLRAKNEDVCTFFAMSFLHKAVRSPRMRGYIGETSIAHFTRERFLSFPIPLPSLPEQKAIAGVLECWDRGLKNLELKIVKKRTIKKGLMQALLSGKIRVPGFGTTEYTEEHGKGRGGIPEGWKEVRLGEIFSFLKTYALSRAQLTTDQTVGHDIYNLHYGDLHATYDGCMLDCDKEKRIPLLRDSTELPPKAIFLEEGDVVIADVSEDYEGVGVCVELRNVGSKKITGGLHTFAVRDTANKMAKGYRGYVLKEVAVSRELKRIATGVSVHGVSKTNLAKVKIVLPCLEEQHAIASLLSSADAEINALERKLAVLKDQKRFLLNNLVTGTIRLPEFCNHGKHGMTQK